MPNSITQDLKGLAIIGMAGSFPGSKTIEQFWQNLSNAVESMTLFTDEELAANSVDQALLSNNKYVKAGFVIEDVEMFDASFFGFTPREAEIMDPQHRIFLECAWQALENAGYEPEIYQGCIGVYAGTSLSNYLVNNLISNQDLNESVGYIPIILSNHQDYLATRVAYKLNLKGPSISIGTACSTSLVSVHMACQGLLSYECDMALAGGVTVNVPQKQGYLHQEGGVVSPDGHCRAFDAKAQGCAFGSGVGLVVLKRLEDARADGDYIYAVIKGSAINNDGLVKVSYTAPSVQGQARVIAEAQAIAGFEPETITYIETHGTGTALGDPIEINALKKAFGFGTKKTGFCAIGSVKTNVGHLNAAAGITSLIKTALALKNKKIPPSLHFEQHNPEIDFANSPFYVNTELCEWKTEGIPCRAGVSSFGIGGTNAHVVLEETPAVELSSTSRPWQLLLLSTKTSTALEAATVNLSAYLQQYPDLNLADVAYTLQVGRRAFDYRRMVVCQDLGDAVKVLTTQDPQRVFTHYQEPSHRRVVFMFPGQGAQYVNMGQELYQSEPIFREQVDECSYLLEPHIGLDLRTVLYPSEQQGQDAAEQMLQTAITQPALFVIEYAQAQLWMAWGVHPEAMIGHSIGEYVAATLAGVFSLKDALVLVAKRGKLMQQLPTGAMLSVQLPEQEVQPLLAGELSLAASNAPSYCVVSGSTEAIEQLQQQLQEKGVGCRRLHTNHAFHSVMMEPIIEPFTQSLQKIQLNPPQIPFVSNVSGTWITNAEATDPNYWARHLRQPVRFSEGITDLLKKPERILLEVGPGRMLSTFAKQHQADELVALTSLRHPQEQQSDVAFLLHNLGRLWLFGVQIEWSGFYTHEQRHRIPLPTYPFERQRYWIEANPEPTLVTVPQEPLHKKPNIADWFYVPRWKESTPPELFQKEELIGQKSCWLVFVDAYGIGDEIAKRLEQQGQDAIAVKVGEQFTKLNERTYAINPQQRDDYDALLQALQKQDFNPNAVAHFWSVSPYDTLPSNPIGKLTQSPHQFFEDCQHLGFYSLLFLAQALQEKNITEPIKLIVLTSNVYDVTGDERLCPDKATVIGLCKVIPQEYPKITCCSIDVVIPEYGTKPAKKLINQLLAELTAQPTEKVIAYRAHHRWIQTFEAVHLDEEKIANKTRLRKGGIYLITGGLGGVGLVLAEYLAQTMQAKLILLGRKGLPEKDQWDRWLTTRDEQDNVSRQIRKVQSLEALGAEVMVISADVANEQQMQNAIALATERFGEIHGVIHAAGNVGDLHCSIHETSKVEAQQQFHPKVYGLFVLEKLFQEKELDFCLLTSSLSSVLGGLGFVSYSTANIFMDAFAHKHNQINSCRWISVNWDGWKISAEDEKNWAAATTLSELIMTPKEGVEVFKRLLFISGVSQVVVSTGNLQTRIDQWIKLESLQDTKSLNKRDVLSLHSTRKLQNDYVPARNEVEQIIAHIWQQVLGIEKVGIHDNFFELGGSSLISLQVVAHLQKELNVQIPVVSLYKRPTVSSLAEILSGDENEKNLGESSHYRGQKRREKKKNRQSSSKK